MTEDSLEALPPDPEPKDALPEVTPDQEDLNEEPFDLEDPTAPLDDVDNLLAEDGFDEEGEPDDDALSREEQDLAELVKEEPLELLENPAFMVELSEDPVRLYLKEIGGIDLLDTNREFWLATQMEAAQRIVSLERQHPLVRKGDSRPRSIYRALYDELQTAWKRVIEDTNRLGFDLPDPGLILEEAQMLTQIWDCDTPSYLHAYLDNGR